MRQTTSQEGISLPERGLTNVSNCTGKQRYWGNFEEAVTNIPACLINKLD